jgi:hypothetical protein
MGILSLTASYPYAQMAEVRRWLLKALNGGDENKQLNCLDIHPDAMNFSDRLCIGATELSSIPPQISPMSVYTAERLDSASNGAESASDEDCSCLV